MCFFRYDKKDFCIFFFVSQKEVLSLPQEFIRASKIAQREENRTVTKSLPDKKLVNITI